MVERWAKFHKEADERKIARLMVGEETKVFSKKELKVGEPVLEVDNLNIWFFKERKSLYHKSISEQA